MSTLLGSSEVGWALPVGSRMGGSWSGPHFWDSSRWRLLLAGWASEPPGLSKAGVRPSVSAFSRNAAPIDDQPSQMLYFRDRCPVLTSDQDDLTLGCGVGEDS